VRDGIDGLIVPAQSATALREALEQFVGEPERVAEMGASAAAAMARQRKWDHFAIDMLDQYGRARATRAAAT
jgi:hypothetical protein